MLVLSSRRQESLIYIKDQPIFFNRCQGFPGFSNRLCGRPNNLELTPHLPEIFQLAQGLSNRCRVSSGAVKNIGSWPSLMRLSEKNVNLTDQNIACLLYDSTSRAPFSVKINVIEVLNIFVLMTWTNLRTYPSLNYLNTIAFSHRTMWILIANCLQVCTSNWNSVII